MPINKKLRTTLTASVMGLSMLAANALADAPPVQKPSSVEDIKAALFGGVPGDRWKEGLLFEGIKPSPWMKSAANWFPRSEDVQPNEMRIIFMGSAPFMRPGQMNTAILVELGNGDIFMFDIGEGSPANIIASGYALNEISDVFITHLHVDHFGGLPYLWMFGTWAGGWHENLTVHGAIGARGALLPLRQAARQESAHYERGVGAARELEGEQHVQPAAATPRPLGRRDAQRMRADDVSAWIAEKPEERAEIAARLTSKDMSTDETLASRILGEYGDNERVAFAFFSEYQSGSWSGSASSHWDQLAETLDSVTSRTALPKLRRWASDSARSLRKMAERDRQREDEEKLRGL